MTKDEVRAIVSQLESAVPGQGSTLGVTVSSGSGKFSSEQQGFLVAAVQFLKMATGDVPPGTSSRTVHRAGGLVTTTTSNVSYKLSFNKNNPPPPKTLLGDVQNDPDIAQALRLAGVTQDQAQLRTLDMPGMPTRTFGLTLTGGTGNLALWIAGALSVIGLVTVVRYFLAAFTR